MIYATHRPARHPTWSPDEDRPIACPEKIKVLKENRKALREIALDALHAPLEALHNSDGAARHEACYRG